MPNQDNSNEENQFGLFTEEEMKLKQLIRSNRFQMINHLTEDGMPKDNGTMRILNEVMSAADSEIVETAKLRHSVKAQKDNNQLKQIMLDLLATNETPLPPPSAGDREVIEVEVLDSAVTTGQELFIENYIGDEDENNDDDL